ncbi:hypothetical protein, partial [Streptomyces lonegramiae]
AARRSLMVIAGFLGRRPWDLSAIVAPFYSQTITGPDHTSEKNKSQPATFRSSAGRERRLGGVVPRLAGMQFVNTTSK